MITTRAGDRNEMRSQRSASCDDRSAVPFSVNESELLGGEGQDFDSARASIADWVDIFNESHLVGFDKLGMFRSLVGQNSDQFAIEFELSDVQPPPEQSDFKLPEMEDVSAIDALNEAFVHDHSVMAAMGGAAAQKGGAEVSDVKARLANLEVQNFSITEMLQKNAPLLGRRT